MRARKTSALREAVDVILDVVYRSGGAATLAYHLGLQGRLRVKHHAFRFRGRAAGSAPLRVAFASDFHSGPVTHHALIEQACAALTDARPDVLLLGGDFISLNVGHVDEMAARLREIPAPLGRYAVLGNHDYRRHRAGIVSRALELHGVEVLHNGNVRLPPPHDDVWICGLDDVEFGSPDPDAMLQGADGTRLVIMHGPDGLLALGDRRFELAFCGHTHGGQIALPGGTPILIPGGTLNRTYSNGLYDVRGDGAGGKLLVSRGVGCSTLPVRLFAPPEVHLCEIW
jgi:predicted MPP superfamily phosphohydrolase